MKKITRAACLILALLLAGLPFFLTALIQEKDPIRP